MAAEYTPGPWRLAPDKAHPWVVECPTNFPGSFGEVAKVGYRPNARLIAAAPDLLEALRAARVDLLNSGYVPAGDHGAGDLEILRIDAAIAKAIG